MTNKIRYARIHLVVIATQLNSLERYRSGHNEAVLKTVCPQGRVGSNPTLSVVYLPIGEVPKLAEGAPLERE